MCLCCRMVPSSYPTRRRLSIMWRRSLEEVTDSLSAIFNISKLTILSFTDRHPTLKPYRPDSLDYDRMITFERAFTRLPIGALSLGSFIHDDLKLSPKAPFIGPVRQSCLSEQYKCAKELFLFNNSHGVLLSRREQ